MPATAVEGVVVENEAPAAQESARVELMRVPVGTSDALTLTRDPSDMLAEATKAAKALMAVMASKPDKVMMNGQQYIENEDWQTIGHFYGATAQIESDHFVEFGDVKGWEATAILVSRDGRTLGRATAMCLNDEEKWSSRAKYEWHYVMKNGAILNEEAARKAGNSAMVWEDSGGGKSRPKKQKVEVGITSVPMFQLRSMAQTRASSKVHRTVLAFVPVLAGFSPTPAEELPDAVRVSNAPLREVAQSVERASEKREVAGSTPALPATSSVAQFDQKQQATDGLGNRFPATDDGPNLGTADPDDLPDGFRLIDDYKLDGDWHHVTWGRDAQGGWMVYKTKLAKIGLAAKDAYEKHQPVRILSKKFPFLDGVESLGISREQIASSKFSPDDPTFCAKCGMPMARCEC